MAARNPFKPTAGATPPLLIGREDILEEFEDSILEGPGAPLRLMRFTGARGVGKTVMLTEVTRIARDHGWTVISETATPGFTTKIINQLRRLNGSQAEEVADLQRELEPLLDRLEQDESGVLITIDEVQRHAIDDLREISTVYQHLVREGREVALVFAGLPSAVSNLLSDEIVTFLRRATPVELEDVPLSAVSDALLQTITEGGRTITEDALRAATVATGGYPFMVQLVGYHIWRKATQDPITEEAAAEGVSAAIRRLGAMVHATALADLSDIDRTYLVAMSRDDGPSRTADVAERIGVDPKYASVYRARLIEARIIAPAQRGEVDFALPYLREYLRDHATNLVSRPLADDA